MDIEAMVGLFSSTSVPIACLCAVFWLWNKERDVHKEEVTKLTEAVNNNTIVIEKVLEAIRRNDNE